MNSKSELHGQLQSMIKKAIRSLNAAKRNIKMGDYDFASSRAYYAAFYAIEAVLLTKELSFAKHSAVISAFNRHFVKVGLFPKEFSKSISRLFRERQIGDYDFGVTITECDAQKDVEAAEAILEGIRTYVSQETGLSI
jgi:uncharacterized protein (UPF0332 family)